MLLEDLFYTLIYILFATVETGMLLIFLYKTLGLKPPFKPVHLVIVSFISSVIGAFLAISYLFALWRPLLSLVVLICIIFIFFDKSIGEKLLYTTITFIVVGFSDNIPQMLPAFFPRFPNVSESLTVLLLILLISLPLQAILYLTILHVIKKGRLFLPRKYWIVATISFSFIAACYFVLLMFDITPETKQQGIIITVALFVLLLFWFVLYFAFYFVCRYYTNLNEMNLIAMQNEMLDKYVLQKQESDRMIRLLSHDLKHNLGRLKTLADQNGDADSIAEYEDMLAMHSMINVGNDIANAVINEKRIYAQRGGIDFKVDGGFSDGLTITRIDFCSLLGNLLDNALEAAEQVEDISLRRVSLQIGRKGHQLLLFLENGYGVEPKLNGKVFVSKKKNRGLHGIGMLSINNIVEKYDGVIENTFKDNRFKSSLMLRCYE